MKKIGIVGGGPAALFLLKHLLKEAKQEIEVLIFERYDRLGSGMPYSPLGAGEEHITNVSGNEIPELVESIEEWMTRSQSPLLNKFNISPQTYKDLKVLPRLLFGEYLADQFHQLIKIAADKNIHVKTYLNTAVTDIKYADHTVPLEIITDHKGYTVDEVIICSGHFWPKINEGNNPGWFDSPYPTEKLRLKLNYPVAIKGASLTAIDAIKTLARENGKFIKHEDGEYDYVIAKASVGFKLVLHSIKGLLPGMRFHLEDSHLSEGNTMSQEEIQTVKEDNNGFVPLDYVFDKYFKQPLQESDKLLYDQVSGMNMEEFVDVIMKEREVMDPMQLFKQEYKEAEASIQNKETIQWKEWLAILSYQMNYPAKHFSAEDMLRLKRKLMPLIAIIIAFVPQSSAREMIALHKAGVLEIIAVDTDSQVIPLDSGGCSYRYKDANGIDQIKNYKIFIDAVGQKPMMFDEFPFKSLQRKKVISPATIKFQNPAAASAEIQQGNKDVNEYSRDQFYLRLPGINVNDNFQVLDEFGAATSNVFVMAVPLIAGLNPDYSGLDFCDTAGQRIAGTIFS